MAASLASVARKFAPSRVLGAMRRRSQDVGRAVVYWSYRSRPITDRVLFESFQGKVIGDNPFYIYRAYAARPNKLPSHWTIRSGITEAPEGAGGVVHGSKQWALSLATSSHLVNNTNFPWYFRKRRGQRYLQTWHGTPLKKLMRDIDDSRPNEGYLRTMEREAKSWDFLISPNPYCSDILPSAFSFGGPLLETGYPRNDDLVVVDTANRQRVREQLGVVDPNVKVVLYAPTWRDYERLADGRWAPVTFIDHKISLPENTVMWFRGHTNTHDSHSAEIASGATDVTGYPNVTELCMAADVLVTDYSSIMFDFTVTGKPLIILAPDIEVYERERGFYFDFRQAVPGPVVHDQSELELWLQRCDELTDVYKARYDEWSQTFHPWEHGTASERVASTFFDDL